MFMLHMLILIILYMPILLNHNISIHVMQNMSHIINMLKLHIHMVEFTLAPIVAARVTYLSFVLIALML